MTPYFDEKTSPKFWKQYFLSFNETPNIYSAQTYETLHILNECLKTCNYEQNTTCIKNCIYNLKNFPGVTGKLSFDKNGDAIGKRMTMMLIQNGHFLPVAV